MTFTRGTAVRLVKNADGNFENAGSHPYVLDLNEKSLILNTGGSKAVSFSYRFENEKLVLAMGSDEAVFEKGAALS